MDENTTNPESKIVVPETGTNATFVTTGLAQAVEEATAPGEAKPVGAASVVDMDAVDPFPSHDEDIAR